MEGVKGVEAPEVDLWRPAGESTAVSRKARSRQRAAVTEHAACAAAGTPQAKRRVCALPHFLQPLPLVELVLRLSLAAAAAVARWWQGDRHHTQVERLGICLLWRRPQVRLLLLRQHALLPPLLPVGGQGRCFWEPAAGQAPEGAFAWQPSVSIPGQLLLVERQLACWVSRFLPLQRVWAVRCLQLRKGGVVLGASPPRKPRRPKLSGSNLQLQADRSSNRDQTLAVCT